jgi:hypothetical protein
MSSSTGSRPTRHQPRGAGELTMQELVLLEEKAPEACRILLEQNGWINSTDVASPGPISLSRRWAMSPA